MWLSEVQLTIDEAGEFEVADSCEYKYSEKSKVWTTLVATDSVNEIEAARALCQDQAPPQNVGLNVVVRSPADPYLVAGRRTKCSYDFGPTAEELQANANLFAVVGAVLFSPAVVCGVFWVSRRVFKSFRTAPVEFSNPPPV
jgi:hypothetical protein